MARLLLATPEGQQTVELRTRNTLGRHPDNSIQLLDKIVSKEHCVIELRGTDYISRVDVFGLRQDDGSYAEGRVINDTDGKAINVGSASTAFCTSSPPSPASRKTSSNWC
jgi:pSer/pThr/pTyr-binding forkhead associated (FHA) protein